MGRVLTDAQIDAYREQGFVAPIDVMSEAEAARCAARFEAVERSYPGQFDAERRNNPHLAFTLFDELAHHPRILDAVEDLIGHEFSLWGSVLFIKEPGSRHYVSWHQDATYMGIEPHEFVTPWIALTSSNPETGCMSMIPGSHRDRIQRHEDTYANDNILTRGQRIPGVDESAAVDLILHPGQMSLHHARTIHGSRPNRGGQRRIGFALQAFMPADARQTIGANYWLPMRGTPRHPDLVRLRRPRADMDPGAVAERDRANRNFADILYHGARCDRRYSRRRSRDAGNPLTTGYPRLSR